MRQIHFSDTLEQWVAMALEECNIEFIHESEDKEQVLDFYLPFFDVYLEVKQFHSPRIEKQMASKENVIVIQGKKAVGMFTTALKRSSGVKINQQ